VAESLRKQIINSIRELVAEIGLTVDTDSLSFRETEFTLLKAVLQDAGILPIFHASESQELRIKKCYKAFADDRDIIIANNSMSLLEQQINYLKQIAIYEGITAEYNVSSSQLLRKLKLFNAVRGSLSGPCLTNAVAWHVLKQVQELSGGVWGIPDKLGDAAKYVRVIGQPYAEFDGVAAVDLGRPEELNFIPQVDAFEIEGWFKIASGNEGVLYTKNKLSIFFNVFGLYVQFGGAANFVGNQYKDDKWHFLSMQVAASATGITLHIDNNLVLLNGVIGILETDTNAYYGAKTDGASALLTGSLSNWKHYSGNGESRVLVAHHTFSESQGSTVYDTENANDLTLINATLGNSGQVGDFWQFDDTGELRPNHLLDGCFKRTDNNALVPKGVDTSAMTGAEIQPFDWLNLPYTILYPVDAWADDMDKDNTTNWETAGGPTGREWSYEQIAGLPAFKKDPVDRKVFRKKNGEEIFIADPEQSGACLEKTEKWAGEIVGAYLWVTQGSEQVYQNNVPVYIPN